MPHMDAHYTYTHRRNDTGEVFYVGKGKGNRAWLRSGRSEYWQRIVAKHGYSVELIAENLSEAEAFRQEKRLIRLFSRATLCNLTDGGDGAVGAVRSPEAREKIAAAKRGVPKTAEQKARISAAKRGVPQTEAAKAKRAAALRGRVFSEEHRANLSRALYQRMATPESRAKISQQHKGKVISAESRAKMSAAHKGKTLTLEHRAKIAAAFAAKQQ